MDIKDMSKKDFKKYVNDNGFFINFNADRISKDDISSVEENGIKINKEIPDGENILIFKGIASQNYGVGEKSRNGYKIDQKGWVFDNYANNPLVLLQHNHEYGGIGYANKLRLDKSGNLNIVFFVDKNTLDEKTKYQVEKGYITAVSTSHITHEDMIEDNKTGKRMTREEAMEQLDPNEFRSILFGMSNNYTLVVTKAEMIENSLVTIGSNESAIVSHNGVNNYFTNKYLDRVLQNKPKNMDLNSIKKVMKDFGADDALTNKVVSKINDLEEKESDESKTEETTPEKTEEETKPIEETTSEVEKKEETNTEATPEETKAVEETTTEEKEAYQTQPGETPAAETTTTESENEEVVEQKDAGSESEKDTSGEQPQKSEEVAADANSVTLKNSKAKSENDNAERMSALEKKVKEQEDAIKLLTDSLIVVAETATNMQNQLRGIVVDGVSLYSKAEKVSSKPNQLTNIITKIKS